MDGRITGPGLARLCPVCKGSTFRPWLHPPRSPGPVVVCAKCAFTLVNPILRMDALIEEGVASGSRPPGLLTSSNLDEIKGSYEEPIIEGFLQESPAKIVNAKSVLRSIKEATNSRGSLLDFGCGCGLFLSVAAQEGWDCQGIEPLVMHSIYARGRFGLPVVTGTLDDRSFPAENFDVVTSFQVFEHLIHPDQVVEKIRRILKQGGLLVIEVPNIDTFWVKLFRERNRHFVEDHVSFFSSGTLKLFLTQRGFRIKRIFYPDRVMSVDHLLTWLQRYRYTLGSRLRKNLSQTLLDRLISINVRDIVTVFAEKTG